MLSLKDHLAERQVNLSLYSVYLDDISASFILFNPSGKLVGYQRYTPSLPKTRSNEGRYFTYRVEGELVVFGVETLKFSPELFIVEGIFDAVKLHNVGKSCVAVLGGTDRHLRDWLFSMGRKCYTVRDINNSELEMGHNLPLPYGRKDLGECTETEVLQMVREL